MSVSTAAAMAGTYGMQAAVNSTAPIYVTDDSPNSEPQYRARFYFNPNSVTMPNSNALTIFNGYQGTSTAAVRVQLRYQSGYQIRAGLANNALSWTSSGWFTISNAPHYIEFYWAAATAAGANNGFLTLWIDGTQRANLTGIANDTLRIDRVQMGAVAGIPSGTLGTYYFDTFESRRQTYIGP